jgi:hypothetical protein
LPELLKVKAQLSNAKSRETKRYWYKQIARHVGIFSCVNCIPLWSSCDCMLLFQQDGDWWETSIVLKQLRKY